MQMRWAVTSGAFAILLGVAGIGGELSLAQDQPPAAGSETSLAQEVPAEVAFHVPTMLCAGCQYRVEGSIRKAPGILDVAFAGQDVTVTYDPSVVTPGAIEAAIEVTGDVAEPVGA